MTLLGVIFSCINRTQFLWNLNFKSSAKPTATLHRFCFASVKPVHLVRHECFMSNAMGHKACILHSQFQYIILSQSDLQLWHFQWKHIVTEGITPSRHPNISQGRSVGQWGETLWRELLPRHSTFDHILKGNGTRNTSLLLIVMIKIYKVWDGYDVTIKIKIFPCTVQTHLINRRSTF